MQMPWNLPNEVTPAEVARRRAYAKALQEDGFQAVNPLGALAKGLSGALAGWETKTAADLEGKGQSGFNARLAQALGDGSDIGELASLAGDPWANQGQSAIISALAGKEIAGPEMTSDMQNWEYGQTHPGFLDAMNGASGGETFYGTGIPVRNADGTISYGQFGSQGSFNIPELGEGQSFLTPVQQLDTGTAFTGVDKFGNPTGQTTPIDNFGASQDEALGKVIGEAAAQKIVGLPQTIATSNNMLGTIDGILNDPALDTSTGWLAWMQAIPNTDQYRFGQRALQLQGQAFLQAFDGLRGGGQITQIEGEKATQAIARLSSAQNPADYRDALTELKGIVNAAKQRAVDAAASVQLPGNAAYNPSAGQQGAAPTTYTYNPVTGELE